MVNINSGLNANTISSARIRQTHINSILAISSSRSILTNTLIRVLRDTRYTSSPISARISHARIDRLQTLRALIITRTLAQIHIREGLRADASILARIGPALVYINLTQSSSIASVAIAIKTRRSINTSSIYARVGQTIVNLRFAVSSRIARETVALEFGQISRESITNGVHTARAWHARIFDYITRRPKETRWTRAAYTARLAFDTSSAILAVSCVCSAKTDSILASRADIAAWTRAHKRAYIRLRANSSVQARIRSAVVYDRLTIGAS